MNRIAKPAINNGEWARAGHKTHKHVSGVVVRYDCNRWLWEIVGGKEDGNFYSTLTVAQYSALR